MSYKKFAKFLRDNNWKESGISTHVGFLSVKTFHRGEDKCVIRCGSFLHKIFNIYSVEVFDRNGIMKYFYDFESKYEWHSECFDTALSKMVTKR